MTTITAATVLRSRHSQRPEKVLSTLLCRYPRWIHAELMTHRQLSRNAASSRAIPVAKLIQDVKENPAVPLVWGKNQKGMQSNEEHHATVPWFSIPLNRWEHLRNEAAWLKARDAAVLVADAFATAGYHKQIVNRLLEPFAHITVLISATEWSNFLALRDHPDAEPHIQILAREIRKELDRDDNIQTLKPGQWHLPFADDWSAITTQDRPWLETAIKLSLARCASTSYKTVDGFDMTLERAIEIADKLIGATPLHASPAEHLAQADTRMGIDGTKDWWKHQDQHGNFVGFRQYRKMLPNECL